MPSSCLFHPPWWFAYFYILLTGVFFNVEWVGEGLWDPPSLDVILNEEPGFPKYLVPNREVLFNMFMSCMTVDPGKPTLDF